jgi:aspartyl protease family protein
LSRLLPFAAALCLTCSAAQAQNVSLAGQMGGKALLVIDGQTQMLAVGEAARGVRMVRWQDGAAVVESGGVLRELHVGGTPARLAASGGVASAAREVVIPVTSGGHFVTAGSINGRPVRFMVDTGATLVALSQAEADRIGVVYRDGERVMMNTANGSVPAHRVTLGRLRLGEVELVNVAAIVVPAAMPMVLLGNSVLARFQMRRENDVMRLEMRP